MPEPQDPSAQAPYEPAQGAQPDLAGHPNSDALAQSYRASSAEARKWRERSTQLEELLVAVQRQQVPQRGPETAYDRLRDLGVPPEDLKEAVRQEIQAAFQPIAQASRARTSVMGRYPEYSKYEADVAQFIESDPNVNQTYQRMFGADPEGATEYAYLKFGETRRKTQAPAPTPNGSAQAAIPSTRTGESRRTGAQAENMLQESRDHFNKTGDPVPYIKQRLRQVIPDSFFQQ